MRTRTDDKELTDNTDKELTYDELEMIETQIEELKEKKKKIEEERKLIKEKERKKRWKEIENAYDNWIELLSKYEKDYSDCSDCEDFIFSKIFC